MQFTGFINRTITILYFPLLFFLDLEYFFSLISKDLQQKLLFSYFF